MPESSGNGMFYGGIVAVVAVVGGGIGYLIKQNRNQMEGGEKETKKLFKTQIKSKNIIKK